MINEKELYDLLQEEEEKKTPTHNTFKENKDVIKFIRKSGITSGSNKVPTYVIYYHFIKWTKKTWTKQWGKTEFFRTFRKYFELKRSGHQRYYLVNDALDLSDELYEKAKKYDTKWQKNRKKK